MAHDQCEARRKVIRGCLNEIATELGIRLREADLRHAVYLVVPTSGNAVLSMVTPLDPSDEDWCRTGVIVRNILSERLDGINLRNVELPCAIANDSMGTAEITGD